MLTTGDASLRASQFGVSQTSEYATQDIKYLMQKKKVVLLGSVPMSLGELQMAPSIIAAHVQKQGHDFEFYDLNLKLFEYCNRDMSVYTKYTEILQDYNKIDFSNKIIDVWQQFIVDQLISTEIILVNVFSVVSQIAALRLIKLCRAHYPDAKIIIGGIGSHKRILSGTNEFNQGWIEQNFSDSESDVFGQACLDNRYIDDWQPTVDLTVLDKWLPKNPVVQYQKDFDFDIYQTDQYIWSNGEKRIPMLGSNGCVRQCSFCDVIKHFPRYSFVQADALTKSIIDAYQQTGIAKIQFMDSLVNGSMTNFLNLLKNLSQAKKHGWLPQDFSWSGTYICRPRSVLLDEIHEHLLDSGVDNLIIGVETGSDRVRYEMNKKFLNEDLLYELAAFEKYGVKASALFFPSWPTETAENFQETLDLFEKLRRYGQSNVLHDVNLGTQGFSLIDGTPIDLEKNHYGLEPGPLPWLWKCNTNPSLTFWETIRRRLLMAEWCEMHGIQLDRETEYRRYLLFSLSQHHDMIMSYSGALPETIDVTQHLPGTTDHRLTLDVVNSSSCSMQITIQIENFCQTYCCSVGPNSLIFDFSRHLSRAQSLTIQAKFPSDHQTHWAQYNSGDYYDQQGLYLDKIVLDHNDITMWGWNHTVDVEWEKNKELPEDHASHSNHRCLTNGMTVHMHMPQYYTPHKYINSRRNSQQHQERKFIDLQLYKQLNMMLKQNNHAMADVDCNHI